MSYTVVAIMSAFFVIGIVVGIIAVVAMSVFRNDRRGYPGDAPDYELPGPGRERPGPRLDDADPADKPRWPGDAGGDFSGR